MGIPGYKLPIFDRQKTSLTIIDSLWDILGEGEIKSLAQLSTDHFQKHKRPLRVAIDEAGWRFHNLSDAQVHAIRQKVPEANPIEKAILWRVLKLMRMIINLSLSLMDLHGLGRGVVWRAESVGRRLICCARR